MDGINKGIRLIERKLLTTFLTTSFVSLAMAAMFIDMEGPYHRGDSFIGWLFVCFMIGGPIILVYGNLVSLGLEYGLKKRFKGNRWLYLGLHAFFGAGLGIVFPGMFYFVAGAIAALVYVLVDQLLIYFQLRQKKVYLLAFIPIILSITIWGFLESFSPQEPPFTQEDAVKMAARNEGIILGTFPDKVGKVEGTVNDYRVTRESSASEKDKGRYLVVFTERWEKNGETGSRSISFLVDKNGMTDKGEEGEVPPYYFDGNRKEEWTNQAFD